MEKPVLIIFEQLIQSKEARKTIFTMLNAAKYTLPFDQERKARHLTINN
jgi:hypothetical protein